MQVYLDLELLCDLEEGLEAVLGDVDLPEVDEVHQAGQVAGPHVRQQQDGVLGSGVLILRSHWSNLTILCCDWSPAWGGWSAAAGRSIRCTRTR